MLNRILLWVERIGFWITALLILLFEVLTLLCFIAAVSGKISYHRVVLFLVIAGFLLLLTWIHRSFFYCKTCGSYWAFLRAREERDFFDKEDETLRICESGENSGKILEKRVYTVWFRCHICGAEKSSRETREKEIDLLNADRNGN